MGHNSYYSVGVSLEGLVNAAAISVNNISKYSESEVGGIAGHLTTMMMSVAVSNCASSCEIAMTGHDTYIGDIVGEVYGHKQGVPHRKLCKLWDHHLGC